MQRTHFGQHEPDCFGCKLATVQWADNTELGIEHRKRDRAFAKDGAAYKRLRAEGLQPLGIDNSSKLEMGADHKLEVELGRPTLKEERKAYTRDLRPLG